jgi:hypothetical protein
VPTTASSGTGANVTVTITSAVPTTGINQGGFDLSVSTGTLSKLDTSAQILGGEATHTFVGNDQRSWTVHWEPPGTKLCEYTFRVAGNAVNGDGVSDDPNSPGPEDHWNLGTTSIVTDGAGDTTPPTTMITIPAANKSYVFNQSTNTSGATIVVGNIRLRATASDDRGIDHVEFIDTDALGSASLGNGTYAKGVNAFELAWDTTTEPPGQHTLTARAFDCNGNSTDKTFSFFVL